MAYIDKQLAITVQAGQVTNTRLEQPPTKLSGRAVDLKREYPSDNSKSLFDADIGTVILSKRQKRRRHNSSRRANKQDLLPCFAVLNGKRVDLNNPPAIRQWYRENMFVGIAHGPGYWDEQGTHARGDKSFATLVGGQTTLRFLQTGNAVIAPGDQLALQLPQPGATQKHPSGILKSKILPEVVPMRNAIDSSLTTFAGLMVGPDPGNNDQAEPANALKRVVLFPGANQNGEGDPSAPVDVLTSEAARQLAGAFETFANSNRNTDAQRALRVALVRHGLVSGLYQSLLQYWRELEARRIGRALQGGKTGDRIDLVIAT